MRKEFEMTPDELKKILSACKPTPVMYLSGGTPMCNTPQENANAAWQALGKEKGFDWESVQPVSGKGMAFFTAEECAAELVESPVTSANK